MLTFGQFMEGKRRGGGAPGNGAVYVYRGGAGFVFKKSGQAVGETVEDVVKHFRETFSQTEANTIASIDVDEDQTVIGTTEAGELFSLRTFEHYTDYEMTHYEQHGNTIVVLPSSMKRSGKTYFGVRDEDVVIVFYAGPNIKDGKRVTPKHKGQKLVQKLDFSGVDKKKS